MRNYRRKLDIIADILHVAKEASKKTQIMYQANLSYTVLERYLARVVAASLVRFEDETGCYRLTDKGREYLDAYKRYSRTHKRLALSLNKANARKKVLEKLCKGR